MVRKVSLSTAYTLLSRSRGSRGDSSQVSRPYRVSGTSQETKAKPW
jgi:hypothetical protein